MGREVVVAITDGKLDFGPWEQIFYGEFDGRRKKRVREAQLAGLAGDIGLKIDAAATATFGFEVSGRYAIVLSRESTDPRLRLQMFKLSRQGLTAGRNVRRTR